MNGEVFLSSGSSDEVWGNDGRDADDYDVAMTEIQKGAGQSRHYVGPFDPDGNIAEGDYQVAVYHQLGANPADTDPPLAQGQISWADPDEITISVVDNDLRRVKNVYGPDVETAEGVIPEGIEPL